MSPLPSNHFSTSSVAFLTCDVRFGNEQSSSITLKQANVDLRSCISPFESEGCLHRAEERVSQTCCLQSEPSLLGGHKSLANHMFVMLFGFGLFVYD